MKYSGEFLWVTPNSSLSQSSALFQPPTPPPSFTLHHPRRLSLSHTHQQRVVAALCPLHKHSHRKEQKTIYPLLLSNLLPPSSQPPPPPLQKLYWGRIEYPASLAPSSLFFLPPVSLFLTHTHISCAQIQTEPSWSTAVHEVTNWDLCLLKGRWRNPYFAHTPTHTYTHWAIHFYCGQVLLRSRQWELPTMFKRRNMVLPLWEVESVSSLRDWYRDRQINREKDGKRLRWRNWVKEGERREQWMSRSCGMAKN